MSDKEARALAAGDVIDVNGKEYRISPVGMRQLHEVQREAVKYYKRQYLATYSENLDLFPEGQRADLLAKKFDEVAKWDVGNLPVRLAYDVRAVPINEKIRSALEDEFDELPENEVELRFLLAAALDRELISFDDVVKLTGIRPRKARIPYDSWWVTAVREGMIAFVAASLKANHPEATKADVEAWPLAKIVQAARLAESITSPDLGNT